MLEFAEVSLEKTLDIIRDFFIVEYDREEQDRRKWLVEYKDYREKIREVFKRALRNKYLKPKAEKIIAELIQPLSEPFWFLEEELE